MIDELNIKMTMKSNTPERIGTQGWQQFLASKQEMLYQYDLAKIYSQSHIVQVSHGNVAEASFRRWLSEFLPKRYGVCSGYIVSQNILDNEKFPHYDVIIYDQINSPILWIEENFDNSVQGKARAIPAEHVNSVIEVKSVLNRKAANDAIRKLEELKPLLQGVDKYGNEYKGNFPNNFCTAAVFFELKKSDEYKKILNNLIPTEEVRYFGGLVLKGEGLDIDLTGKFQLLVGDTPIITTVGKDKESLLKGSPLSNTVQDHNNKYISTMLTWSQANFSMFAFDLIAILNSTYRSGYISSFYGMSWINPERNKK